MSDDKRPEEFGRTTKLQYVDKYTIVVPGLGRFGVGLNPEEITYHKVPAHHALLVDAKPWRIHLKFGAPNPHTVVGLEV